MSLFYFLLFAWVLNSIIPCSLLPKLLSAFCLPWFQLLNKLESPKRFLLWDCSSSSSRAVAAIVVFPFHFCLLLLVSPPVNVCTTAALVSTARAAKSEDLSCCVTALLPLGHWLAVLFTWAFEFLWACLTLHELHGCFAFVFSHLMLIEVEQPTSCSSALIYVSVPVTT